MSDIKGGRQFWDFMREAKKLVPESSIPNYENYSHYLKSNESLIGNLQQVVFMIDFMNDSFPYISPNSFTVYGYSDHEMYRMGFSKFMEFLHPKDHEIIVQQVFPEGSVIAQQYSLEDIFNVIITFSYRLKQKNGEYITLLNEFSKLVVDEDGNPLIVMGTTTNISEIHTKPELFSKIYFKKSNGKKEKIFERYYSLEDDIDDFGLTKKEIEIIKFIHKGLSSKEIANLTNRSEETIKSQRKSILSKTGCQSMTEVVVLAVKNNWV